MRHRNTNKIFDRKKGPRTALLRMQLVSLVRVKKLTTTKPKAKLLVGEFDKLVTIAKKGTLLARRQLLKKLNHEAAVKELMDVLSPALKGRTSGYVKMTKVSRRVGDAAEQIKLEIIQ